MLVKTYQENVTDLFPHVLKKLRSGEDDGLFASREFKSFISTTASFFKYADVLKVQIFDSAENEIFRSNNMQLELSEGGEVDFMESLIAKIDYVFFKGLIEQGVLLPKVEVKDKNNKIKKAQIIVEYIPISESIEIVIYKDITSFWREMFRLEYKIFLSFFIFFSILFVIVVYNTRYAQSIINKQFQINKLLEEAKKKAESESTAKTQFLANVSHELRTPLNAIIGFSEIILSERNDPTKMEKYLDYVTDIHNSGKHLLHIITDILDYSQVTAKKLKVDLIEINLNKIASSSMRFIEPRAKEGGVKLFIEMPDYPVIIKADPQRLKQALLNLLSNAVKFTPENGSITLSITLSQNKKRVVLKVADTGIGISEANLPKALALFEQVDDKKDRRYEGTGLGLPLTKKLIELMKGTFEISSIVGKGTVVALQFKVYMDGERK